LCIDIFEEAANMPKSWLETGPDELYSVSGEEEKWKKARRGDPKSVQYHIGVRPHLNE
jgi:hypothetical protein